MASLQHLFPQETASTEEYTYPRDVISSFKTPPRDDRVGHGEALIRSAEEADKQAQAAVKANPQAEKPKGVVLDFRSDPKFKLQLKSLEIQRSGIELRNSRIVDDVMHATVFVPEGKLGIFTRKFEAYVKEDHPKSGKPKNQNLVDSISEIRLAALESFWTDAGKFPSDDTDAIWWEVWLKESEGAFDIAAQFRGKADSINITVGSRELRFPERRVLLARATVRQWTAFENLFDILAELRIAKTLPGEFLQLSPRNQAEFVEETLSRIHPPPTKAPAVCHLDTGINRGHPLLQLAIFEEHVLACEPEWSPADRHGHGTEMAGLALYGCLTDLLNSGETVQLGHRLESVKILPDRGQNDPDLYGDVTNQAMFRIEVTEPDRNRAFCLTVTTDGRDEGYPSSWTAAIDATCSGANDDQRRLLIVSAGNTPEAGRHHYPDHSQLHGVLDPAQSWNAVTVGAYTEKIDIHDQQYADWKPIAELGGLSPASCTSIVWNNRSWPLKPDIVMEGGNLAIDPSTGNADYVDDLMLLTTQVKPTGALLTTTADTSASAALAARLSAMIWEQYPELWPETVRALLVHSARWTERMLEEFPHRKRHNRLRCYGHGVPNLAKALWSLRNSATLIIEEKLQPYQKEDTTIKTKDMHLHHLPWPKQVLEELGEVEVKMRVTLSYYIEPSPGRRGWTRKHCYQSHGLRFEVKRPTENLDQFQKRLSKAAWDDGEEEADQGTEEREWELGAVLRSKGSLHSDTWSGTAAELAASGILAVFPVTGWWRVRKHLERIDRKARYALVVSLETSSTDIDLYTPIANEIGVSVPIEIDA